VLSKGGGCAISEKYYYILNAVHKGYLTSKPQKIKARVFFTGFVWYIQARHMNKP
jgi:hypothetical protein